MERKFLEIRDRHTFIPAMAILVKVQETAGSVAKFAERYLISSAGHPINHNKSTYYIVLFHLSSNRCHCNWEAWGDRTMKNAHLHLMSNWNKIRSGDVIDVEYILAESPKPKESQFLQELSRPDKG